MRAPQRKKDPKPRLWYRCRNNSKTFLTISFQTWADVLNACCMGRRTMLYVFLCLLVGGSYLSTYRNVPVCWAMSNVCGSLIFMTKFSQAPLQVHVCAQAPTSYVFFLKLFFFVRTTRVMSKRFYSRFTLHRAAVVVRQASCLLSGGLGLISIRRRIDWLVG